ncbi:nucleoside-diphosphate kinase [bacterium]|nr:nucleoside-diphosphate kinase [bacterium]MBU1064109.1 nucleoside-diphosphate kinase [bacterium]MBU1634911.1 nucleoside-diphosphate kinase [bacterium]MBU1872646.1 nucleoside-diphosphate kinase [bacterium]
MNNKTLAILKPDCLKRNLTGKVIDFILNKGFTIKAMKQLHLTEPEAERFYAVHKGKDFYDELIEYMSSGPCIPMVLEKENAVETFREIIGTTDPKEAAENTLRRLYAKTTQRNTVHGSDSDENAQKEIAFFFPL